jgi:hypothetical protein
MGVGLGAGVFAAGAGSRPFTLTRRQQAQNGRGDRAALVI